MKLKDNIVIAISKGRILEEGMNLLNLMGIDTIESMEDSRKLIYQTNNSNLELVIVRAADVPTYVGNGAADIGIVGKDTLVEYGANNIYIPLDLNISKCRMALACLPDCNPGPRIKVATKYVKCATDYFIKKKKQVDIIKLYGSMELAPILGLADYIVDLVDSGMTLRANGLKEVDSIFDVSAQLVTNKASMKTKTESIENIINAFEKIIQ
ncbi:MAG: ATP phosphoribosyltransferase [Gammaproteobacteria bacterium]|jgi:ATP phosphoribosyltransferase|nr:ATP phosphoribosyltransferase [Gammaproteobacteria bacterium]|tara:strand:- start:439 stop:1071 length:633 start_codon:yes stop_codon:yes gene_type:complete